MTSALNLPASGHAPSSGLRNHSVGADYPYVMVASQRHGYAPLSWSILDARTGNRSQEFHTSQAARIHLTSLRLRNVMHG